MKYDETYRNVDDVFGTGPEKILEKYIRFLDPSRRVLDVGAGQGRNAFFLAGHGFQVDAVDPSRVAVETIEARVRRERLPVRTFACGFAAFEPDVGGYSGVAVFGIIPLLPWESIRELMGKIGGWVCEGGLVFLTAFTTADPGFGHFEQNWNRMGKNSFSDEEGTVRTYLEEGEIVTLLPALETVYHWEGVGPEHRHGDGPVERHGMAEAVFRCVGGA